MSSGLRPTVPWWIPPLLRRWGMRRKIAIGPWGRPLLRLLARLKTLRGGPLDIFGASAHRRRERALIDWYEGLLEEILKSAPCAEVAELAAVPLSIRGYEELKERRMAQARERAGQLLGKLRGAGRAVART